jgi:uncharacterized Fe-S cluster-containing radical SAM superfamily protein
MRTRPVRFASVRASAPEYQPEACPYPIVVVDITHRCNMTCGNCYLPNRVIPDPPMTWLLDALRRLPKPTQIRLVGGEPTVRTDLPDVIRAVRAHRHRPWVLTNGLKLADAAYVRTLKDAGLRRVHLSMNGGRDEAAYQAIGESDAAAKARALEHLCDERMHVAVGMLLVRGVNEHLIAPVLRDLLTRPRVGEFHLRSIGPHGRYMMNAPFMLAEMIELFADAAGVSRDTLPPVPTDRSYLDFPWGRRLRIQLTQWPDLNSLVRGRLTPEGTIQPFFEHMIANDGGY